MRERSEPDPVLIRYLLGELPADEEATLDERGFVDDAWDEERAAAADDLIDAYLSGGLTADQRARFETRFLASSENRQRFRLLRDLRSVVARADATPPADARRGLRVAVAWAVAAALIVAAIAALLLTRGAPPPDPRIALRPTPSPSVAPTPSPSPGASPGSPAGGGTAVAALPARPGLVRIEVGSDARVVRLVIPVPADGPDRYVAQVRRGGRSLWEAADLDAPADGATLSVDVPAAVLDGEGVRLVLAAEATRSGTARAVERRVWSLRLVRR